MDNITVFQSLADKEKQSRLLEVFFVLIICDCDGDCDCLPIWVLDHPNDFHDENSALLAGR